jgi:hypothetical protein
VRPFSSAFVFAFRLLFPYGLSVVRRSISEPFSDDAFQCAIGAGYIIDAEPNAMAVPEIELGKVTVQVLLAAMLVDAFHAALEYRIEAFNGIGVNDAAHIFLSRKVDGLVHPEFLVQPAVCFPFIAHDESFFRDVGPNDWKELAGSGALYVEASDAVTSDMTVFL